MSVPSSRWKAAAGDADFAPYLDGTPEHTVAIFWRFVALVRGCGPVVFELQRGLIVLRGTRRIFASVSPVTTGLTGHINLPRQLTDRRIRKVEPLTMSLYFHKYRLTSMSDLDDDVRHWLCEARDIGDGGR